MLIEWLVALAVFVAILALIPPLLRRAKANNRKSSGGSGVFIAIGMVLAMIFDPKASQATELIQRKQEIGDEEDAESGEKPY